MNCQEMPNIRPDSNLVYLNKIYFSDSQVSCPILYDLTTTAETFTQQLTFGSIPASHTCTCGSCGCSCSNSAGCGSPCSCCCCCCDCGNSCSDFTVTANTTFTITDASIEVSTFRPSADSTFSAPNVTVDGFPVTALQLVNGQYQADLSGIMADITKCPCTQPPAPRCRCLPDDRCITTCTNGSHFFMAQVPGPWVLGATIILRGTAKNGSRTCSFHCCMQTIPATGGGITITGADNFAMNCVEIPCQTGGVSPTLSFDFCTCVSLQNPSLTVTVVEEVPTVALTATLVLTPEINLQTTRQTLFRLKASEVPVPCDNVGQCDSCDPFTVDTCCCESLSNPSTSITTSAPSLPPSSAPSVACQCCETNGYRF